MLDQSGAAPAQRRTDALPLVSTIGLCLYLYVSAVGVLPFADRRLVLFTDASDGNILKQVMLFGALIAVIGGTPKSVFRLPFVVPVTAIVLFGWCFLTLTWSPVPDVGLRRLVLTGLSVLVIFSYASSHGAIRLWQALSVVCAALVLGSLVSGLVVSGAIHQLDDPEAGLAGDWRGLLYHKNTTGFVAAISSLIFFWRAVDRRRWIDLFAFSAGILLLVLSGAKTSMAALPVALVTAVGLHFLMGRLMNRFWLFALFTILVLMVATIVQAEWDVVERFVDNPSGLTGRTAIWSAMLQVARGGSWVFGTGFASLFGVGSETPLAQYLEGWLLMAGHAHNGYLELLISTGVPGLLLAVAAFVLQPMWRLLGPLSVPREIHLAALSSLIFVAISNMLETSLMDRSNIAWIVLLVVTATAMDSRQPGPVS